MSLQSGVRLGAYDGGGAIGVTDYPALRVREMISSSRSAVPQWSPDGSEVWFAEGSDTLGAAVRVVGVAVSEVGGRLIAKPARRLWTAPEGTELYSDIGRRGFGTNDGKQFLVRQPFNSGIWRVTIIQNLPALLNAR